MNGPEHYKRAEELLADVEQNVPWDESGALERLEAAQVHATLALAAATALPRTGEMTIPDCEAWERAASAADLPPQSTAP